MDDVKKEKRSAQIKYFNLTERVEDQRTK